LKINFFICLRGTIFEAPSVPLISTLMASTSSASTAASVPSTAEAITRAVIARIGAEAWDAGDVHAAFLQATLLSYKSAAVGRSVKERAQSPWDQMWNLDGSRYIASSPTDYAHNCPWNDWTPPSEARRRATAAKATNPATGLARIRVKICRAPDSHRRGEKMVVAFASIEVCDSGVKALVLRRGSETLLAIPLHRTRVAQREGVVRLSLDGSSIAPVFLYLEDAQRCDALLTLFA